MRIGVSSSCYYPLETEKSLIRLGEMGVKTAEIFFNSPSELSGKLFREICEIKSYYGMEIVSFHPFMSFAEGYFLFSNYERRFYDSLETIYKPCFEAAANLGAKYVILHGARGKKTVPDEEYAERFFKFNEKAKSFGVNAAHENVVHYSGESPEFMLYLKKMIGDSFNMVLDIKQARRTGVDYRRFLDALCDSIIHVHVSDFDAFRDCTPPKRGGQFDFYELFDLMEKIGYNGKYIIELYSDSFRSDDELKEAYDYLKNTIGE
ncbi:MAG: sugar phosphate isomerase/epimerase family protein [Acutalibacteraceae bacterium]